MIISQIIILYLGIHTYILDIVLTLLACIY